MNNRQLYRTFPLLAALWGAILLGGCTNDRPFAEPAHPYSQGVRLSLRSVRSDLGSFAAPAPVPAGTKVGFFMQEPGTGTLAYTNVPGGYNATLGAWTPDDSNPIWVDNRNSTVAIYAPYSGSSDYRTQQFPLKAALCEADGSNDLLAATFTATNQQIADGIDVSLSHVYTRLVFTFVKMSGYTDNLVIDQCRLSGADIISAGTYDLFARTYTAGSGEPKNIDATVSLTVPAAGTPTPTTAQADLLFIPLRQVFSADAVLEVHTTDGKHMQVVIPKATFTAARPFAPGKQYNFTVKLSPSEMEIAAVSVNEWEATTDTSGEV